MDKSLILLFSAGFLAGGGALRAQVIRATADTISVKGSKYQLQIDRPSGVMTLRNPAGAQYTRFPLFAEPVPSTAAIARPVLSWEVSGARAEMTARNRESGEAFLKSELTFRQDAFEVRFGVLPELPDLGYQVSIVNGSWPWGLGIDTSFARNPLSICGKKLHHGLGGHAYSNVKLSLWRSLDVRSFHALVGVDDEVGKNGSVVFQVVVDGKQAANSGIVRGGEPPRTIEASVAEAKTIELVVTDGGDGEANDHADWGDARFVLASGGSVYVSDLISREQQGAKLFCSNGSGFDTTGWQKTFTPEPDDYYSKQRVMVDVRQDVDGERFYAPAPLNLSFQTPAGWFSTGLGELPDATGFRLQNGHLFIPYPWRRMNLPKGELYWTSPLCFTFSRSEWDAIADYRKYLLANKYAADVPVERKQIPEWWMWPLLCTWSEQAVNDAAQASPKFTPDWVKSYVLGQEKALGLDRFTLIIDDKWQRKYGDPRPDPVRFTKMRELIDWIHSRGHKVLLWWRCWYGEPGSLPDEMGLLDKGYIDATHPRFESYVREALRIMLGNAPGEMDADGIKVDYIFDVRDPVTASYARPFLGMGIREVYRFADIWYRQAKKIKKDCLLTFSGPDPHFALVQDMTRINDAGLDPLQRQWRARVTALAAPNLLIDGDGADMFVSLADYHHVVSSAYGTPALYNLTRFSDGPITEDMHKMIGKLFRLAAMKKPGHPIFISPGNWQYVRNERTVAESFQDGTAFVVYPSSEQAFVISTKPQDLAVPVHHAFPTDVRTEEGGEVPVKLSPAGGLVIPDARRGEVYTVSFQERQSEGP